MPWTDFVKSMLGGAALLAPLSAPALAAAEPSTRLVSCGAESCLLVTGFRADPTSPVQVNGRLVVVEGRRHWRARLSVAAVREWSAPYARTMTVSVAGANAEARLPIGLLGHVENLAVLTVSAK